MVRVANGVSREALRTLSEAEARIAAYIERRLDALAARGIMLSRTARDRIASIIAGALKRSRSVWQEIARRLRSELIAAGHIEAVLEADSIARAIKAQVKPPSKAEITRAITRTPIERGNLFGQTLAGLARGHQDALQRGIRAGVAMGETARQVLRRTFGTAAANHLDGYTGAVRRGLDAFIGTAWLHATNVARRVLYAAARQITRGYVWNIVLDTTTCLRCVDRARGSPYQFGAGPIPPEHPACRCSISPILVGFEEPEVPSYDEWLRRQPTNLQREALGPTRHRLWRSGKVKLDRFVNDRGNVITLEELARREGFDLQTVRDAA